MKFLNLYILTSASLSGAAAQCNEMDHHPENGGFFLTGAAGLSDLENVDSAHGQKLANSTWAAGLYYPHGEYIVCDPDTDGCRAPCDAQPGCEQYYSTHTCSILSFCPLADKSETEIIYELPDFEATDACDFSSAIVLGEMNGGASDSNGCFQYAFEEDHELKEYFFASKEGCEDGQRIAIKVEDFGMTADQCKQIGFTTPRIRNCDCRLETKPSTLGEPCRTAFSDSCQDSLIATDECCEAGTCLSIFEDYEHPEGKAKEDERVALCNDEMPGLCYNEDSAGTDTNMAGSTNCCSMTCSECGIQASYSAQWKECSAMNAGDSTANCGFLSRYAQEPFQCDFSKCKGGDHWHIDGPAYKSAFGVESGVVATSADTEVDVKEGSASAATSSEDSPAASPPEDSVPTTSTSTDSAAVIPFVSVSALSTFIILLFVLV